jgi:hypothetical protein
VNRLKKFWQAFWFGKFEEKPDCYGVQEYTRADGTKYYQAFLKYDGFNWPLNCHQKARKHNTIEQARTEIVFCKGQKVVKSKEVYCDD